MVRRKCQEALETGFKAVKLKVGSKDPERDLRRASIVREVVGPEVHVMLDANQQWTIDKTREMMGRLQSINPFWLEEPTHVSDVLAHAQLRQEIAPVKIAVGEGIANRVAFKNYFQVNSCGKEKALLYLLFYVPRGQSC